MTDRAVLLALGTLLLCRETFAYCVGWDKTLPTYDPQYYSVTHERDRSEYVVLGLVLHETWLGEDSKPKPLEPPFQNGRPRPWGFDPYSGALYDVEVIRSLNGRRRLGSVYLVKIRQL